MAGRFGKGSFLSFGRVHIRVEPGAHIEERISTPEAGSESLSVGCSWVPRPDWK